MKHSIKKQMMGVFIGLMTSLILVLLMINVCFLEPYYIRDKKLQFINMYQNLESMVDDNGFQNENAAVKLVRLAEKNNISFVVEDVNGKRYSNVYDFDMMMNQLTGYLLNQAQKDAEVLERTEQYQINQSWDPWNKTDYIDMWGTLDDGSRFLMRSPLESIKESAKISNRFLIGIGSMLMLVGAALVWYLSRRMTTPIQELTALSEKMADLDFDVSYTSGGSNEIGRLGENFNRMSNRLESTISELKKANNRLKKDIEQKEKLEEMRNDFLGNVSHELKTPIAMIQGYAEGLKEGVSDDPESRAFYCDVIMDEASKMNQMVKNLLTLNQLEFGDEDIVFERFNLTELIRGVLQSMEILAQQSEAEVIFRQEDPICVWADEFKTEQVVRNYISNAFHHVSGNKIVEVKMQVEDDKVKVSVFNTGTPIPEEDQKHLWDKFYKVDKAHTREYGGNGIGLSIVKAIMESFHQRYGVKNYGNGVEFWFELDVK